MHKLHLHNSYILDELFALYIPYINTHYMQYPHKIRMYPLGKPSKFQHSKIFVTEYFGPKKGQTPSIHVEIGFFLWQHEAFCLMNFQKRYLCQKMFKCLHMMSFFLFKWVDICRILNYVHIFSHLFTQVLIAITTQS